MVLVQRRIRAVFGRELHVFVRTEGGRVAVHRHQVGVAGEEHRSVGHVAHRLVLAQGGVDRVGVGQEVGGQGAQVEGGGDLARPRRAHGWGDLVLEHGAAIVAAGAATRVLVFPPGVAQARRSTGGVGLAAGRSSIWRAISPMRARACMVMAFQGPEKFRRRQLR